MIKNKKVGVTFGGDIPSIPREFVKYFRAYKMRDFASEVNNFAEIIYADYVHLLGDYCTKNDLDFEDIVIEIEQGDIFKNWKKYVKNA